MFDTSKRVVSLVVMTVFLASCTLLDELPQNTSSTWITLMDEDALFRRGFIHLRIDEGTIWEPGDEARGLREHIWNTLQISIDGILIPSDQISLIEQFTRPIEEYDGNERLGSHYDAAHVYLFDLGLLVGQHHATVEVTSTSDVVYTYSWSFEVIGVTSEVSPTNEP